MPNKHKNKRATRQAAEAVVLPQNDARRTVAIVGGGASGLAAACAFSAGARALPEEVRVVVIEQGRRVGSSILRSGNGRCNFTHENMDPRVFNQPAFIARVLEQLEDKQVAETLGLPVRSLKASENMVLRWFASLGLVWREAPLTGGALYPFSNKATSVLEVLEAELDRCGVERFCGVSLVSAEEHDGGFALELQNTKEPTERAVLHADALIYAGGGMPAPVLERGVFSKLDRAPVRPVLGPLRTNTTHLEGLDGLRARVRLNCEAKGFSEEGELLFRSYGISGIVVFNASRFVDAGDTVSLDLVPERSLARLEELLRDRARLQAYERGSLPTYAELLQGFFLPELASVLIGLAGGRAPSCSIACQLPVDDAGIGALAAAIKSFELEVEGIGEEAQCQVHRGGVRVEAVDRATLEAQHVRGLYVSGEALDVDGPCGGYNLHWAWASGLIAGLSAARAFGVQDHVAYDGVAQAGV